MKFNSQICTTKEQSDRLLALGLKKETADMVHVDFGSRNFMIRPYEWLSTTEIDMEGFIPAWSLHRLIEMIPITVPDKYGVTHYFTIDVASEISYYFFGEEEWEIWKSWSQKELYDNVIDCIEWLIKEGHFNKEYLEK